MLVLSNAELADLVMPPTLIGAVEAASVAMESRGAIVPKRLHLPWDENTLLTMPAVAKMCFGTKVVSVIPQNAARGFPVTNGLMVLNDRETGLPLAVMNATELTAQRTGAIGALGLKHVTPTDISSVGIIGCGLQGTWQAIFACVVRPVKEVFCFSRSADRYEKFRSELRQKVPEVKITSCGNATELLERTRVVITATTSSEPVLPDEPSLLKGKHFISIGSYRPTMQELPDSVYRLAGRLVIDSEFAREEVGDVINPVRKCILKEADVFSIGKLVTGQRSVDLSRTTAYKSVGMALYDLYVAQALYEAAVHKGIGHHIHL